MQTFHTDLHSELVSVEQQNILLRKSGVGAWSET